MAINIINDVYIRAKLKDNSGITLIALVVTIVVLLILVVITISLVFSENRIIAKAREAAEKTKEVTEKEKGDIEGLSNKIEDFTYRIPKEIDSKEIKENPELYYGMSVKGYSYPCLSKEDVEWKIFYADENNIYLIANDYVDYVPNGKAGTPADKITDVNSTYCFHMGNTVADYKGETDIDSNVINLIGKYNSKYPNSEYGNMRATAYMLDTKVWGDLYKGDMAEYAIGTPTLELFLKSYNNMYSTNIETVIKDDVDIGYYIEDTEGKEQTFLDYKINENNLYVSPTTPENGGRAYGMWIASPSAQENTCVYRIYANGELNSGLYWRSYDENFGFRPVVCLKKKVILNYSGGDTLYLKI